MVGGVTVGYWAIGRANTASPPASVTTADRTVAKIGRSMKQRGIIGGARSQASGGNGRRPAGDRSDPSDARVLSGLPTSGPLPPELRGHLRAGPDPLVAAHD